MRRQQGTLQRGTISWSVPFWNLGVKRRYRGPPFLALSTSVKVFIFPLSDSLVSSQPPALASRVEMCVLLHNNSTVLEHAQSSHIFNIPNRSIFIQQEVSDWQQKCNARFNWLIRMIGIFMNNSSAENQRVSLHAGPALRLGIDPLLIWKEIVNHNPEEYFNTEWENCFAWFINSLNQLQQGTVRNKIIFN